MDLTQADPTASPGAPGAGPRSCVECGSVLRAGAEFCTECGASAAHASVGAGGPAAGACSECGVELKPGAAFCTECGASSTATPVANAAAAPIGAGAALLKEIKAGGPSGAPPEPVTVPAGERKSRPAESRTILASVGATGYSPRIPSATRPGPPTPPVVTAPTGGSSDNPKRKVLALVAVVALLLVAGIVVITATSGKDKSSVQAGRGGNVTDSQLASHQSGTTLAGGVVGTDTGTDTGSSSTAKGHKPSKGKGGKPTTTTPVTTHHSTSGTTLPKKPTNGTTTGSTTPHTVGSTAKPPPPPPPPPATTVPHAPPAKLSVSRTAVSVSVGTTSTLITLTNTGGSALNWSANAAVSGIHGGTVSPHSGHLAPNASIGVTISWTPAGSAEGTHAGSFNINGGSAGYFTVGVTAGGTNQADTFGTNVYAPLGSRCHVGNIITVYVRPEAAGGAVAASISSVTVSSTTVAGAFEAAVYAGPSTGGFLKYTVKVKVALPNLNLNLQSVDAAGNVANKYNEVHAC